MVDRIAWRLAFPTRLTQGSFPDSETKSPTQNSFDVQGPCTVRTHWMKNTKTTFQCACQTWLLLPTKTIEKKSFLHPTLRENISWDGIHYTPTKETYRALANWPGTFETVFSALTSHCVTGDVVTRVPVVFNVSFLQSFCPLQQQGNTNENGVAPNLLCANSMKRFCQQ